MKMTLNVDEALLERVMAFFETTNKTHAIDLALREVDRKSKLLDLGRKGLGLGPEELKKIFDPDYDVLAARAAEPPSSYRTKRKARNAADPGR